MLFPRFLRSFPFLAGLITVSFLSPARASTAIFDYDKSAPLGFEEISREIRGGALIRDAVFSPAGKPVKAYLVSPAEESKNPHAAILYVHWLGEPKTTNRTEFLDEAVALAGKGVVSLLVDAMWSDTKWYSNRIPEEDYDRSVRQVIELRRAMDLLLSQPGVDLQRVAVVGHDFGAMYAMIASAQDRRAKTYVFMAAVPRLIDWFLYQHQPKDLESYRKQITPLSPINFIGDLAPAPIFFQFASHDNYVSSAQALEFYTAASPRKQMATYDAGHDLHTSEVAADRVAWLKRELDLKD